MILFTYNYLTASAVIATLRLPILSAIGEAMTFNNLARSKDEYRLLVALVNLVPDDASDADVLAAFETALAEYRALPEASR